MPVNAEQLRQLAAAPPVRGFLRNSGVIRAPGLSLFDNAKLQAGRESHWDAMADASTADQDTYKQLLRGLARASGLPRGQRFEHAVDAGSKRISGLAPYMMTLKPELWDQLHGNRGSAASLASAVSQAHPDRTALENSAVAQEVFKKMPQDGGLSARDLGQTYRVMAQEGLLGRRGGLEASRAADRVVNVGAGLRRLIDAGTGLGKQAVSRWRRPDALAALLRKQRNFPAVTPARLQDASRLDVLRIAKARLGLVQELPGVQRLAGELNYKPGYMDALHNRLLGIGKEPNVLYRGSRQIDPWLSNTPSSRVLPGQPPDRRVVLATPSLASAAGYAGSSLDVLGQAVTTHRLGDKQLYSPDFTHGAWGFPFDSYVRQARAGAAETAEQAARTFGIRPNIVANPVSQENAYETAIHPEHNPVIRRLFFNTSKGVAAVPRTPRWESIMQQVTKPAVPVTPRTFEMLGGRSATHLPIETPIKTAGILPASFAAIAKLAGSALRSRFRMVPTDYGYGQRLYTGYLGESQTPVAKMIVHGLGKGQTPEVKWSLLHRKLQGQGLGRTMYGRVMQDMPGGRLTSDTEATSTEAIRTWRSMMKRPGYAVTESPTAALPEQLMPKAKYKHPTMDPLFEGQIAGPGNARPYNRATALPGPVPTEQVYLGEPAPTALPAAEPVKVAGILPASLQSLADRVLGRSPGDSMPWRKPPAAPAARAAYMAAPGPEPLHSAVGPGGKWQGFRNYGPLERLRYFGDSENAGPPMAFRDPPKKPQLLLDLQNPAFAAAARAQFRQLPAAMTKLSTLKEDVELQPHQRQIEEMAKKEPLRMLLLHGLGSGKSLSGIAAAEAQGLPYTAIAPASLRPNYLKEIAKFSKGDVPADVMSYSALASGQLPSKNHTLIFDEAQSLRNPETAKAQEAITAADQAKQLLMLSATPIVNRPGDLAVPLRMLTGEQTDPDAFEKRYVTTKIRYPSLFHRLVGWRGKESPELTRADELKAKFKGHVNAYDRGAPVVPTSYEDVHVDMSPEQVRLYEAVMAKLPWWVRSKLKNESALTEEELRKTIAFLTGPRQIGLSTYPYARQRDPYKAFEQSPKLQEAFQRMQGVLADKRKKALVFANFIDAGLTPYAAALEKAKIPHAVFHGGLSDAERKQIIEDYNANKLRVLLLGPSGTEGLSTKATSLVQLLDPAYNPIRPRQAVGRALRYDSHTDLPEDLQNVQVQRFFSRLPKGIADRLLSSIGFDRSAPTLAADDHLARLSAQKEKLNEQFVDLLRQVGQT